MGACSSCEAAAVAAVATAKVILPDGGLAEYPVRTRAADVVLGKAGDGSRLFLCNADHLEFGAHVSAAGPDEELHPGQIYFALPRSMLRCRLSPEDMAALAVRASKALVKSGCNVAATCSPPPAAAPEAPAVEQNRRRRRESRGRSFSSDLISIPEIE